MIINKDFALAWRAGHKIEKHVYRNQQESGIVFMGAMLGIAALIIFFAVISPVLTMVKAAVQ